MRMQQIRTPRTILSAIGISAIATAGLAAPAQAAGTSLQVQPLGWNVIGLDHNKPETEGPDSYPVGVRVTNSGAQAATGLSTAWTWSSSNAYVDLTDPSATKTVEDLAPGESVDVYYTVQVDRDDRAFDTARGFQITASADNAAPASTPTGRQLYVEHLVSQNRNGIRSIEMLADEGCDAVDGVVLQGAVCRLLVSGFTATMGYEQITTSLTMDPSVFQVLGYESEMAIPEGFTTDQPYVDACGFDNVPGNRDYNECVGPINVGRGKAGGDPISFIITFKAIGTGVAAARAVIYDKSGSSYHYNDDFWTAPGADVSSIAPPPAPAPEALTSSQSGADKQKPAKQPVKPRNGKVRLIDPISQEPVNKFEIAGEGTYEVDPLTGELSFTPEPGFVGDATGVDYEVTDGFNRTAKSYYSASVAKPASPSPLPRTSQDYGPREQQAAPAINVPRGGSVHLVDPVTQQPVTSVTIDGQGTYAVDVSSGAMTFTPVQGFYGLPTPVSFRVMDSYGQSGDSTYLPDVLESSRPVASPMTSFGRPGRTQRPNSAVPVPPGGRVMLVEPVSQSDAVEVKIAKQGTYRVSSISGELSFTPSAKFTGTAKPVAFRVYNAADVRAQSTYTATVVPAGAGKSLVLNVSGLTSKVLTLGTRATVVPKASTQQDGRLKVRVQCAPVMSLALRGDMRYCEGRISPEGKVSVKTYGSVPLRVRVRIRAVPVPGAKNVLKSKPWIRSWVAQ